MAKCEMCHKTTQFGRNVSFSNRHTSRVFRPNLQKATVYVNGRAQQKTLCTKCIKALGKVK